MDGIIKISDTVDNKLSDVYNKMVLVENKIDSLGAKEFVEKDKNQKDSKTVLPPPPNPKPQEFRQNTDNIRRDLMKELKDIIDKKKGKDLNNKK